MTSPPQPGPEQPATPPPAKPVNSKLVFWTSGQGVVTMLVIMGGIVVLIAGITTRLGGSAADNADIRVTSCAADGDASLATATVGFTVKNTGDSVRSYTVQIEYRDGAGNRIDTDTTSVRNVQPGDTVKAEESTILDATPDTTINCAVVGVS